MKKLILVFLIMIFACEDKDDSSKKISSLTFIQSVPTKSRSGASAVSYKNEIYLIGGQDYSIYYNTIEKLDEKNNKWIELNNQVSCRRYFTAEVVNDVIYIIGGDSAGHFVRDIQAYNIFDNTISNVATFHDYDDNIISNVATFHDYDDNIIGINQIGSVVYNDKIYLIGGFMSTECCADYHTNYSFIFDPSSNSFSNISPMLLAREGDVELIDNKIYAFGGYSGSAMKTVQIYDIKNNTWSNSNDMPYVLSAYHLASIEKLVFLFGDYERLDEINMYDVDNQSWTKLSTNFTGRRHAAVVRNGDWIYVIGGYDGSKTFELVEKTKPFE